MTIPENHVKIFKGRAVIGLAWKDGDMWACGCLDTGLYAHAASIQEAERLIKESYDSENDY